METHADAQVKRLRHQSVRDFVRAHVCLLLILAAAGCIAQENPLTLAPLPPITAVIGRPFRQQLSAAGGVESYSWRLAEGSGALPPGLTLDPKSGQISGVPTDTAGSFRFRIVVSDSGGPPSTDVRTFTIEVPDALTLDWERAPHISQEGIKGSVVVSNQTAHTVDLTVIIVAVNEVGKAFALAEQHFPLPAGMDSSIPFGKNAVLPFGKYTLHADAVGEVASENQIYRTRKQTADDFVIKQQ